MRVRSLATLRVVNPDVAAELSLDSREHRHTFDAGRAVTITRRAVVVGVGTDHGNGFDLLTQRQNVPLVLQQDHALASSAQSDLLMLGRIDDAFRKLCVGDVRMIEDTQNELYAQ